MHNNGNGKRLSGLEKLICAVLVLLFVGSLSVSSQTDKRQKRSRGRNAAVETVIDTTQMSDSLRHALDSIQFVKDSTARADSIHRRDSIDLLHKSSIDKPAFSTAKDSVIEDFADGKRIVHYYGDVSVTYGTMTLTADYMRYDMATQVLYACGTQDEYGEWKGQPVMDDNGQIYTMEELHYNFGSRKAKIKNMITQDSEGILHGQNIKMMPDNSINITKGKYTVCDAEEPHYYLHLTAAKVMTEPSQRTVFGPAYPVVEGVMLPLVLPFGFIPKQPDRATGFLMPTFGEEKARGFFLKDGGMYFVFGDYFDLSVTGSYYTLGSWAIDVNSRYKVNYLFNGTFSLTYSNDQTGEKNTPDFFQTTNFAVKWSHSQDSKATPGMTFSASVNFSSPSNNRYNATNVTEALNNQTSSSISWSKNWDGKFSLSINALHSQSSRDSSYAITFPNLTFSVSRFYPFKRKNRVGKAKFYEDFAIAYSTTLQNKISFTTADTREPNFWDKMQNGMTHKFTFTLPSFTLFKYINFSPSVSYGMNWYFRKQGREYNPETNTVETTDSGIMSAFGISQNFSGSLSASTRLYGMYNFGTHHRIQAIRHVITPSISFSASPEHGTHANGYRTYTYVDTAGVTKSVDYNIYSGQMYSPPSKGKSATMSISIGNNVEAKVRDLRDTTGTGNKKVKIIDNLSINTGWNFLADSLNMSNIGITLSTSVFGKLGLSGNCTFSPYAVVATGERTYATINKANGSVYGWNKPLRLTNASFSLSYSLSGTGKLNGNDGGTSVSSTPDAYQRIYYHPVTGEYIPGGWLYYMNPNAPWSVNLSYSYSYSRSYTVSNWELKTNHRHTQTLSVSGNLKITPSLAFSVTSGVDVMAFKLTTTQISATYDMHCFNIAVSWVPTGTWQSWNFRIAANAAALADLLRFRKSNSYWDNFY